MAATESKTYPITPEQIKSITFSNIKRGGYDPEEVDIFIHQLATIISRSPEDIFGQRTSSEEREDADSAAQRLLSAAQRTADQLIADSKEQAEEKTWPVLSWLGSVMMGCCAAAPLRCCLPPPCRARRPALS